MKMNPINWKGKERERQRIIAKRGKRVEEQEIKDNGKKRGKREIVREEKEAEAAAVYLLHRK